MYNEGHYYKRTYDNTNFSRIFRVDDIYIQEGFMFVTVIRDGKLRLDYNFLFQIHYPASKTVELNNTELVNILL